MNPANTVEGGNFSAEFANFRFAAAEMQRTMDKWPRPAFGVNFAKANHSSFHWQNVAARTPLKAFEGRSLASDEFEEARMELRMAQPSNREVRWLLNRLTWNGGNIVDPEITPERYVEVWTQYRIGVTRAGAADQIRVGRPLSRIARIASSSALAALALVVLIEKSSDPDTRELQANLAVSSLSVPVSA